MLYDRRVCVGFLSPSPRDSFTLFPIVSFSKAPHRQRDAQVLQPSISTKPSRLTTGSLPSRLSLAKRGENYISDTAVLL